ncbi:hypothetical protein H4Q26_017168 [Puccinia striiformis f. sp. tritici PST-130]|nr:hypothetical protein H4Q26_017168 [Puccinia striiformis f. sp. tritici PST-130]
MRLRETLMLSLLSAPVARPLLKSGVAGGIAGCLAKTLVSPLDRVKILFQTGNSDYAKYTGSLGGVFRAISAIWNQAGIRGLVQGHSATLFCRLKVHSWSLKWSNMAVFVTYPLKIVRVRAAIQTRKSSNEIVRVRDVARSLYLEKPSIPLTWDIKFFQRLPITKFYRGFSPTFVVSERIC